MHCFQASLSDQVSWESQYFAQKRKMQLAKVAVILFALFQEAKPLYTVLFQATYSQPIGNSLVWQWDQAVNRISEIIYVRKKQKQELHEFVLQLRKRHERILKTILKVTAGSVVLVPI